MMTQSNTASIRPWWEDHSDPEQQRAELDTYRAIQRDQFALAWRRIALYGVLAIVAPFAINLLGAV